MTTNLNERTCVQVCIAICIVIIDLIIVKFIYVKFCFFLFHVIISVYCHVIAVSADTRRGGLSWLLSQLPQGRLLPGTAAKERRLRRVREGASGSTVRHTWNKISLMSHSHHVSWTGETILNTCIPMQCSGRSNCISRTAVHELCDLVRCVCSQSIQSTCRWCCAHEQLTHGITERLVQVSSVQFSACAVNETL